MRSIEAHAWNIEHGIEHALLGLYKVIPEEDRYLNFFLTDGDTVWAFRKGTSLFYRTDELAKRSYVSSTIPEEGRGNWKEFPENSMAVLKQNLEIQFITITEEIP